MMMMTKRGLACALLALAVACALATMRAQAQQPVSCSTVDSAIAPCEQYLTGQRNAPPEECCSGLRSIHQAATSTQARRDTCSCLKQIASRYSNLRDEAARALPGQCNVAVPIPISRDVDCSQIS
ncbi:hypothetical protein QJS04_geneDACA017712 [Acorus gramineus]|uniref:Non-specific lipid-transfer protein n=1 Tax=Acorus gramineus TaxID=55184 RepID=A0AAV9BUD3_ACOGR|nr:hypothetical protein QJS04_geneDACA017712 [Acorus gramineus]